jgi:hypothetical protein
VLPSDNRVGVQVGDVNTAGLLGVVEENHPADVGVQKTLADRVRILVSIGESVVDTVTSGPPSNRALDGTAGESSEENTQRKTSAVRTM